MAKKKGLMFWLASIFGVMLITVLAVTGVATYLYQMELYRSQCRENVPTVKLK